MRVPVHDLLHGCGLLVAAAVLVGCTGATDAREGVPASTAEPARSPPAEVPKLQVEPLASDDLAPAPDPAPTPDPTEVFVPTGTLERVRGNWEFNNHIQGYYGHRHASAGRSHALVRLAVLKHNREKDFSPPTSLYFPNYPDLALTIGLPVELVPALQAILAGRCPSDRFVERPMAKAVELLEASSYRTELASLIQDLGARRCPSPAHLKELHPTTRGKQSRGRARSRYRAAGRLLYWAARRKGWPEWSHERDPPPLP